MQFELGPIGQALTGRAHRAVASSTEVVVNLRIDGVVILKLLEETFSVVDEFFTGQLSCVFLLCSRSDGLLCYASLFIYMLGMRLWLECTCL